MLESIFCLSMALYHEARDQEIIGQIAVAQVIQHRVESKEFPNTVCEVVKQKKPVIQFPFSWAKPEEKEAWATAQAIAELMLNKDIPIADVTNGALCYARKELPSPCSRMTNFVRIGDHNFWSDF